MQFVACLIESQRSQMRRQPADRINKSRIAECLIVSFGKCMALVRTVSFKPNMSDEPEPSNVTSGNVDLPNIDDELARAVLKTARFLVQKMTGSVEGAEDLRQTALLKYLQLDDKARSEIRNPSAYLSQLMKNELLNRIRKEKAHLTQSVETLESKYPGAIPAYSPERIEVAVLLREIWNRIDGQDRQLLELMNFSYKGPEIAHILNISDDAARQRISRLKDKIKVILREKEYSG